MLSGEHVTVLQIYRAPSGQISARVLVDSEEVMGVAGCPNAQDVWKAVVEAGYEVDSVELGEGL